jgi:hypothetical protein
MEPVQFIPLREAQAGDQVRLRGGDDQLQTVVRNVPDELIVTVTCPAGESVVAYAAVCATMRPIVFTDAHDGRLH